MSKRLFVKGQIIFLSFIVSGLLFLVNSSAKDLFSESYRIQMGNINYDAGSKSSASYQLNDTLGETGIGESGSTSYTFKAGFQYVSTLIPLSISLSNNSVSLGDLSPQIPATESTTITASSGAAYGFDVFAYQNNRLQRKPFSGIFIPDVTGDNSDITYSQEGDWNLNSTYGFGYTLTNVVGSDATFASGYRSFADLSLGEPMTEVMSNTGVSSESSVRVDYKVNISSTQESGDYQNTITYVLVGKF